MTRRSPEQSLLAGTLTTFRRRCGKPSCRCAAGDPHETPALRYTEGGRTRLITLATADVAEVAAALARYQQALGRTGCGRRRGGGGVALPAGRPARGQPGMTGGPPSAEADAFVASRALFGSTLHWLDGAEAAGLDHAQLETQLQGKGGELLRQLFQDSMDLRAHRERPRAEVVGADAVVRTRVESGHTRALTTVFGEVSVSRMAYRAPGRANLHPADAELNLPAEKHSHGLRRLAAIEAARGSFDDTVAALIDRPTPA